MTEQITDKPYRMRFTQEQCLGLIPAQTLIDSDRAREVLERVADAAQDKLIKLGWKPPAWYENVSTSRFDELARTAGYKTIDAFKAYLNSPKVREMVADEVYTFACKTSRGELVASHEVAAALLAKIAELIEREANANKY